MISELITRSTEGLCLINTSVICAANLVQQTIVVTTGRSRVSSEAQIASDNSEKGLILEPSSLTKVSSIRLDHEYNLDVSQQL